MAILDFLTSTRRPPPGTPAASPAEVVDALLALNRPTAPWQVIDGRSEDVDVIAEWKIVDARWYEIFAKVGLRKTFRIFLKLYPDKHQVRALDKEYEVAWRAGVPTLSLSASLQRGQVQSWQFGRAYAFTESLEFGEVYKYRFSTKELKKPLQDAVTSRGWTYSGVTFGRL